MTAVGCAIHHPPPSDNTTPSSGFRLLYRAEVVTPDGTRHFKMAAAVRPPDHLRLEFFGPVGGPRMILATDGSRACALLPPDRLSDSAPASPATMARLTGLRFAPAGLVDLLRGLAPCRGEDPGSVSAGPGGDGRIVTCRFDGATVALRTGEGSWADSLDIALASPDRSIRLQRIEGPFEAPLADALFAPAVPDGFTRGHLLDEGPPLMFLDAGPPSGERP